MKRVALILALALVPESAFAHAALLGASPKAGSVLAAPPASVRLLFSEEIVPDLCNVSVAGPGGFSSDLRVSGDPYDVHAVIAPLPLNLGPGAYSVTWRVVSADGHPVKGTLTFTVTGSPNAVTFSTLPSFTKPAAPIPPTSRMPVIAALLRGLGVAALAALVGLLGFAITSRPGVLVNARPLCIWLAVTASVALAFHLLAWGNYIEPGAIHAATWRAILRSTPGMLETLRLALAVLSLLGLMIFRRRGPSFYLAAGALLMAATIGHSGSITPLLSVPLLAIHLIAVATWLGGLTWLLLSVRGGPASLREQAFRVSRMALVAAIAVGATGLLQSLLLVHSLHELIYTVYGRILFLKVVGWITLISFGGYHRYRALPAIDRPDAPDLRSSVRYEMTVMVVVFFVAAFLSYSPTPQ